jgi:transcriptional antiterminator
LLALAKSISRATQRIGYEPEKFSNPLTESVKQSYSKGDAFPMSAR